MLSTSATSFIIYPACGTDLSPLLTEQLLRNNLTQTLGLFDDLWSKNTLLQCDDNEAVFKFYSNLRKGEYIYSSRDKILLSESLYKKAWTNSKLDSLKVTDTKTRNFKLGGNETTAIDLNLLAVSGKDSASLAVSFLYCEYEELEHHIIKNHDKFKIIGLFILGMQRYPNFGREVAFGDASFVITDFPASHFDSAFLPIQTRVLELGRTNSSLSSGDGAAICLNKKMFKEYPPHFENSFWIIPQTLAAVSGTNSSSKSEEDMSNVIAINSFFKTWQEGDQSLEDLEKKIAQILDSVDKGLQSGKVSYIYDELNSVSRLLLIVGCWIIRHGVASGAGVNNHLTSLTDLGKWTLQDTISNSEHQRILKSWVKGL